MLQEHWLPKYDTPSILQLLPDISAFHCTSTDDEETTEFCKRPICHGGVATLWRGRLNPFIDATQQQGNSRILVTKINIPQNPVCILNCYLPSGNGKEARETFLEDVDTLHELIETYSSTHDILLIGDLNEDHFNRKGPKEEAIMKLVDEHKLRDLGCSTSKIMTYENIHLGHQSHIDHALLKPTHNNNSWSSCTILREDHSNTSYHHPITLTAQFSLAAPKKSHTSAKRETRYNLKKIDQVAFQNTLDEELDPIDIESLDADTAIHVLQRAIATATHLSAPCKTFNNSQRKKNSDNNCVWSPDLAAAVRNSKLAHYMWKTAGRPTGEDPSWQAKKEAKKIVRRVQRRQTAFKRTAMVNEISAASEKDNRLFHKLVKKQRQQSNPNYSILADGNLVDDPDEQRDIIAEHFRSLSTPKPDESPDYTQYVRKLHALRPGTLPFSAEALNLAIKELATGKAKDLNGQAAEQIQLLTPTARKILLRALQLIAETKIIPERIKIAYKIAIPKNGKDNRLMDNHRGITIGSIFLKILEIMAANEELRQKIDSTTNNLQVGFTRARSPSMASLLITEAVAEAHHRSTPVYIATLDARKAFDVVCHRILKMKLYETDISSGLWMILDNLYTDSQECVRWRGGDSDPFFSKQGVKQGSIISPMLYKAYINGLLDTLQQNHLGAFIGGFFVGSPACADDVLLISFDPHELQAMLDVCSGYSTVHRYEIHPGKSSISVLHRPRNHPEPAREWNLGGSAIRRQDTFTHLGIEWKEGRSQPNIQANLSKARRTAYALMRVGMHGCDGLGAATSAKLIQLYVTPNLLHGLDAVVLDKKSISELDLFYRKILRQVQSLPDSTAVEAVHWLSGTLPLEAQYHTRVLMLFGAICRLPNDHLLHKLATRQLALGINRKSWFTLIAQLGALYNIDINHQMALPWPKPAWKRLVKLAVSTHWHLQMLRKASQKSSLRWFVTYDTAPTSPHHLWKTGQDSAFSREAAATRAKMLTGRFKTGDLLSKFQPGVSSICQRCLREEEDILHMLITCPENHQNHQSLRLIPDLFKTENKRIPQSNRELCSMILNGHRYFTDDPNPRTVELEEATNIVRANQGSSSYCARVAKIRDSIIINTT